MESECQTFDYIIVGLGAAGCVLASRLAKISGIKIAIVEAGANYTQNPYVKTPFTFAYLWNNPLYPPVFQSPPYNPPFDEWSFLLTGINQLYNKPYQYPRGVGYSGSASHNALVPIRGSRVVYDDWAKITGDPGWGYENILKYFKKTERNVVFGVPEYEKYHSDKGWLTIDRQIAPAVTIDVIKACEAVGMPFVEDILGNPEKMAGVAYLDIMRNLDGTRASPATNLFLPAYQKSKNITIFDNSLVTRILFENKKCHKPTAIGIEFAKGPFNYSADTQFTGNLGKLRKIYATREVILCGGAINTPQLLLLSGIGPKADLQNLGIPVLVDSPGVGQNLQDNIEVFVNYKLAKPYLLPPQSINSFNVFDPSQPEVQQYKESGKGVLADNITPVAFNWFSDAAPRNPLMPDLFVQCVNVYFANWNISDWVPLEQFDPTSSYQSFIVELSSPKPPFGTIKLRSKNPQDAPLFDESPLVNDANLTVLAKGIMLVRSLINQQVPVAYPPPTGSPPITITLGNKYGMEEGLPTSAIPNDLTSLKNYIQTSSAEGHHVSCTCRMGKKNDPLAVTDPKLKVKGVHHLRIVDASVFPEIPTGPISLAVYVVAERAAKFIKEKLEK